MKVKSQSELDIDGRETCTISTTRKGYLMLMLVLYFYLNVVYTSTLALYILNLNLICDSVTKEKTWLVL